jgi:hypothetical protein
VPANSNVTGSKAEVEMAVYPSDTLLNKLLYVNMMLDDAVLTYFKMSHFCPELTKTTKPSHRVLYKAGPDDERKKLPYLLVQECDEEFREPNICLWLRRVS